MLNLKDFAGLGLQTLMERALTGHLPPSALWMAFRGARRFRDAVFMGDIADQDAQLSRLSRCRECPSITWATSKFSGADTGWCGQSFVQTATTCGCLVALRVHGITMPGGKVAVGSESCPQKKWQALNPPKLRRASGCKDCGKKSS